MRKILAILLFMGIGVFTYADQRGDELAKKYFDLPTSKTKYSESTLILVDNKGNKRIRKIVQYSREIDTLTENFLEFKEPADVTGTKFLTKSVVGKDDEQRLFLPALGKVRKIANTEKDASFMGTELNYYDLETKHFEDFTYRDLGTDTINNTDVFKFEQIAKDKAAPYSKQIVYLDQKTYFPVMVECFDKDARLLKKIINLRIDLISGINVPVRIVVDNVQSKQQTALQVDNVKINQKIPDQVFSIQNLTN